MRPVVKSSSPKRAKHLLTAELGWLRGAPLGAVAGGLRWLVVPEQAPPEELRVDRERLHRANRALRTLLRDHREALTALVGPVEPWAAQVQQTLDRLRDPATGEGPVPEDPGRWDARLRARVASLPEGLAPLVRALAWCLEPEAMARLLPALAAAPGPWTQLAQTERGLRQALVLAGWVEGCGAERVHAVLPMVLEPTDGIEGWRWFAVATDALVQRLDNPRAPLATLAQEDWSTLLDGLLMALTGVNEKGRRRALEALAALRPPTAETRRWWTAFRALSAEVGSLPAPDTGPPGTRAWREAVKARILALLEERPAQWWPALIPAAVLDLARSGERGEALLQGLLQLPTLPHTDVAAAFLCSWTTEPETPRRVRHVRRWARSMRPDLEPERLRPWSDLLERWGRPHPPPRQTRDYLTYQGEPDSTLDDEPEVAIGRLYDFLDTAEALPSSTRSALLGRIFAHTEDPVMAARVLALLDRGWASDDTVKALVRLCALLPDERVRPLLEKPVPEMNAIARGLAWFQEHGQAAWGLRVHEDVLRTLGDWQGLAGGADPLPWPEPKEPSLAGLPAALHEPTRALSRWCDDAALRVQRALHEISPPDAAIQQEIAALEARVGPEDSPLRRRLISLRGRLGQGPLTPRQLERALQRVERAELTALEGWVRASVLARFQARLCALLEVASPPEWAGRRDLWRSVAALGEVNPAIRALAIRVLRRRCGPPPWDLREEPPNAAFVQHLRGRGVRMEPWLDDRSRTTPGEITLRLEPDPLEILQMGAHFGTCLSPGGINFFSAVVNAADVNKRVLYARDARGRVVGRSLVGLTEAGLVVFETYCHRQELDFAGRVRDFVSELAADMGTSVRHGGAPKPLMAGQWYDDGAIDIVRVRERLVREGPLDLRLFAVDPADLVSTLRQALHPGALREDILILVFGLLSFERRPELPRTLATELLRDPNLSAYERTACAVALARAGDADAAKEALPRLRPGRVDGLCCGYYGWTETLTALQPAFVPRLLRVRGEHARLPEDDRAVALALEALGRPVQALAAYREARERCSSRDHRMLKQLDAAIARLDSAG